MGIIKHKMLIFAMLLASISACGKESGSDNPSKKVDLTATPSELSFTSGAGSSEVKITATSKPSLVLSASDWCKVSTGTFSENACTATVTVEANTSETDRTAYISVVCGNDKVKVSIFQEGKAAEPEEDFLTEITPGTSMAWTMAKKLGLGWNLGNQMDSQNNGVADETGWGNEKATQATFNGLKAKGITSVRIPVTWMGHIGDAPDYEIEDAWMSRVAEIVGYAENAGLNAIINIHHDGADSKYWLNIKNASSSAAEYESITAEYKAVWKQIAEQFKDKGDFLIFEAFNEIHDGGWGWGGNRTDNGAQYSVINKWVQEFVNVVRSTGGNNASRYLGIPGYCSNPDLTMENLVLPTDSAKDKLLVAVHCYDPSDYTLEAKYDEWGHTAKNNPAPAGEKEVVAVMAKLKAKYIDNGIPVYFGETGCVNRSTTRQTSFQKYYLEFFYRACRNYGIAPFLWDNGSKETGRETSGFIDHANGDYIANGSSIIPALKDAIFSEKSFYTLRSVYENAPQ